MVILNQIIENINKHTVVNNCFYRSRTTKFDGSIVECDSFPSPIGTICEIECNDKTSTSFSICENCDSVTELTGNNLISYFSKQAEKNNFNYKKHNLEIFGLCENCKLKN